SKRFATFRHRSLAWGNCEATAGWSVHRRAPASRRRCGSHPTTWLGRQQHPTSPRNGGTFHGGPAIARGRRSAVARSAEPGMALPFRIALPGRIACTARALDRALLWLHPVERCRLAWRRLDTDRPIGRLLA